MTATFKNAILSYTTEDQRKINDMLKKWNLTCTGRYIVKNICDLEHFLNESHMLNIINVFNSDLMDELEENYKLECHKSIMKGGLTNTKPIILGRAVEWSEFSKWLLHKHGAHFNTAGDVENFLWRLISGSGPEGSEGNLLMSEFGTWVTWNIGDEHHGPFSFAQTAEEVIACLGLSPKMERRLLLQIYKMESIDELYRPTIADAGLFAFFEPPPLAFSDHGLTKPWPQHFCSGFTPVPRPEALHRPILFEKLEYLRELI